MKKGFLSKYFNKHTAAPAAWTALSALVTVFNFSGGGAMGVGLGLLMAGVTAHSANQWQRAATGRGFWGP